MANVHIATLFDTPPKARICAEDYIASSTSERKPDLIKGVFVDGPPDLAIEIVSPSSRHYDVIEKRTNYARFGTREYWIVNPIERSAKVSELVQGEWIPIRAEKGVLRSKILDGFWLRLDWLFPPEGQERPSELEVARQQGLI